ncbi:hypothetical protein MKX03_017048 [Papaver bracteatum]|nr:hypothetical protein MKX03_017048 [Papaver bracteatum]
MSSASQTLLLCMILLCLTSSVIIPSTAVNLEDDIKQSAYEVIQGYGFPVGLLPVGVKAYVLDKNSGKFVVRLGEGACSFPIFGYEIKYEPTFTGIISNGKLTNLNGISVKVLSFYWVSIIEVLKSMNFNSLLELFQSISLLTIFMILLNVGVGLIQCFLFLNLLCMILLCLTSSLITPAAVVEENSNLSAYDILQGYDFPVGLLPVGVTGYELDKSSGKFSVHFGAGDCSFPLSGYQIKYNGISVKVLFVWANIIEVLKRDQLQFSIGIASAYFPIDSFYESPKCGCGLKCKPRVDPFIVSSS